MTFGKRSTCCMSLRKWKSEFTKKEFVKVIKAVVKRNMHYFNYTRMPYVVEKTLPRQELMCCCSAGNFVMIAYDYVKFKREFGDCDYQTQYTFAVQTMAHEMRHYYQHRQIQAINPSETKKTISNWKENKLINTRGMKKINNFKYWFSARELDANLYAYRFTLDHLACASLDPICNKTHFKALKKLYKQNGGKNIKKYFSKNALKQIEN